MANLTYNNKYYNYCKGKYNLEFANQFKDLSEQDILELASTTKPYGVYKYLEREWKEYKYSTH